VLSPAWTKPAVWSAGRDPLGMQATSVRLYRRLAPGLTNVTNRLRYFSFYCWAVEAYERQVHSGDVKRWQIFIRRAEATYALASNLVDAPQSLGMAGGDWAKRMISELASKPDWETVDLRPHTDRPGEGGQYLKAKGGNFGQFYVASMLEVGMLAPFVGVPIVSEGYGRELARSFSTSISGTQDALMDAVETGVASRDALSAIGKAAHPARIPMDSEEMALLRAYLLGERAQLGGSELLRRSSAWLRLELMTRGIGLSDDQLLRRALYARTAPDGSPIGITGETIDGWRAYQANELGHVSLECLLNGLITSLDDFGGSASPEAAINAVLEAGLDSSARAEGWSSWAREAAVGVNEDELSEPVLKVLSQAAGGSGPVWGQAIRLLATLWAKWSDNQHGLMHEISRGAGPGGRSLAGVLASLNSVSNGSVRDALTRVLQRHVVSEHMAIAGQKLAGAGTFTYHFLLADGEMSEGQIGAYGYTNPRLQNLTRFLSDAGLHEDGRVTSTGERFLSAHQAH
jgi:hypothetical protein